MDNHFGVYTQMVSIGYGNPKYAQVAAAQTYFAIQTRRQELEDENSEEIKRLADCGRASLRSSCNPVGDSRDGVLTFPLLTSNNVKVRYSQSFLSYLEAL